MNEATITDTEAGKVVQGEGWFIVNVAEARWFDSPHGGTWSGFEPEAGFSHYGIGVHVLRPGERPGLYHEESDQESFLVLAGECIAIVEGEERRMGPGDFLHCPPGTRHITVGAGDQPCAILMVGARTPGKTIHYPADPAAARHGASVERDADSPREAYANDPDHRWWPARAPQLSWPSTSRS
jgi:uncharacterized cupin superfamily protein